ncbi:MAG: ATP-binding protein [Solirubrobacterales bacterium]
MRVLLAELADDADQAIAILDERARYIYVNATLARIHDLGAAEHLGRPATDMLSPLASRRILELVGTVRETGDALRAAPVQADGICWEVTCRPLSFGTGWATAVIALDVTERHETLAQLGRRAEQRSLVTALSRRALEVNDLDDVFAETVELLARELDVELVKILELSPGGDEFAARADVGWSREGDGDAIMVTADAATQAGFTLTVDEPIIVDDLATDRRFAGSALILERGVRSGITMRIQGGLGTWGVLAVHTAQVRRFTSEDAQLVVEIATVLAAAVERVIAEDELKRVALQRRLLVKEALEAAERERERIAEALHDGVLQSLLYARQECASALAERPDPVLARMITGLEEAAHQLRVAVAELHPLTVAYSDLPTTIRRLAADHVIRTGAAMDVEVTAHAGSRHDALVTTAVRELLANIARHAPGADGTVRIAEADGALLIEVSDDGPGLDHAAVDGAVSAGHVGLAALLARVEASGGRTELSASRPGATVRLTLPLP